jgi:hypothetical protein
MKYLLTLLALMPLTVLGATVINYDDGSTLTLEEGEQIMVTKGKLYQQRTYNNGRTFQFKEFPETTRRDYVPVDNGTDGEEFGTHAWCKAYVPWSEGFTFTMQYWQRGCDTNNDGTYGCGDEKFDASDDASVCPAG